MMSLSEAQTKEFWDGTLVAAVRLLAGKTDDALAESVLLEAANKLEWAAREIEDGQMAADVANALREQMLYRTGTNCTFGDDDAKALGILAGKAIRAGLYYGDELPQSLIKSIERHVASVDTHAKRGDSTQIEAPSLMGSAVAVEDGQTP
jgi:hypothetical protein